MTSMRPVVIVRGGGDLASGVAARLHRSGFGVVVTEIPQPLAVRRLVAFAEAVYAGSVRVEELQARLVHGPDEARQAIESGGIPVLIDPEADCRKRLQPVAMVDGRMTKEPAGLPLDSIPLLIGLGPGFSVGSNCHAVIETHRGHHLGRVFWQGSVQADTGVPDPVAGRDVDRVLRAPASGTFEALKPLAARVESGDLLARVNGVELRAPFGGVLRGLLHDGVEIEAGVKVGDLDPRADLSFCYQISDKSLAIGGGVLEALLSRPEIRSRLAGT